MFFPQIFERNECSQRSLLPVYLEASHIPTQMTIQSQGTNTLFLRIAGDR